MIRISPPHVFTLMYRGLPRGTVRMQPVVLPPVPGRHAMQEFVALGGWVDATDDYAAVREELAGKIREMAGLENADPEVIEERLSYWDEFYRSNGLEFLDDGGNPVTCEGIIMGDAGRATGHEPGASQVSITALFRRTEEPGPAS